MAVDVLCRNRLLLALQAFTRGEILSSEFDDRMGAAVDESDDESAYGVFLLLWRTYCDYRNHGPSQEPLVQELYRRVAAWLQTDLEWEEQEVLKCGLFRRRQWVCTGYEPFNSWEEWWKHSHLAPNGDWLRS